MSRILNLALQLVKVLIIILGKEAITLTEKLFDNLGVEAKLKGVLRRIE